MALHGSFREEVIVLFLLEDRMFQDTIVAISTGMTASGIGIVRMSGSEAIEIASKIYRGKSNLLTANSHTIHYGRIYDGDHMVDEVLVMLMRGPKTFTGEDTIEINCHGGTYVTKRVLETVVKYGARLAEPGEFTKRAFLNGKMDLSQAEAVIDVIHAKGEYALESSMSQLRGTLRDKVDDIREKLLHHTAFIETALDDPEHISLDGYGEQLQEILTPICKELENLIQSAENGRLMKEGIQTAIIGKPNAGKSSLLNGLSGYERAIVTEIAGTTRDILEEEIQLKGLTLHVMDTAGIRQTEDVIEKIGVEKSMQSIPSADLILWMMDGTKEFDEEDEKILHLIDPKKTILLRNKSDLGHCVDTGILKEQLCKARPEASSKIQTMPMITISMKEHQGIEELEEIIEHMFLSKKISFNDEIYITNVRQKQALIQAENSVRRVLQSIEAEMPEDFYTIDLMDAYEILGTITGKTIGEDLVNEIFSKFCMGK
jgi:tRNA modification GTPase